MDFGGGGAGTGGDGGSNFSHSNNRHSFGRRENGWTLISHMQRAVNISWPKGLRLCWSGKWEWEGRE